jgi:undecaprenyl-diphosphatase
MDWNRWRAFFRHRFAPGEYLGLHLTLGLLLTLVTLSAFLLISQRVHEERSGLYQFDLRMAELMEKHADGHPMIRGLLRVVTFGGSYVALSLLSMAGAVILFVRKRWVLGTVWLLAASSGALLDVGVKNHVDRHRPANPDAMIKETNPSFPSGHAMGSVVGFGMLGYVLVLRERRRRVRWLVVTALTTLVLLIGLSRIYLRAHYFSDVFGGFCIGTVWLAACLSGLEVARRRRIHRADRAESNRPSWQPGYGNPASDPSLKGPGLEND